MKLIKKNIKVIIAFILGIILSSTAVYATGTILFSASQVSFDNTRAGLKNSHGDDVTTVEEAIETLVNGSCSSSPFKLGDYIEMTPTSTSYTPDNTITGLVEYDTKQGNPSGTTVSNTLNPSQLNVWRVIKINPDCTVEVVSEYASNAKIKLAAKSGYQNYVYVLNEAAKQYANTTYTLNPTTAPDGAFRSIGYSNQTQQITDTTRLDDLTLGQTNGAWFYKGSGEEELGGGDTGFGKDLQLLNDADVSIRAHSKGSSVNRSSYVNYWLASREYYWSTSTTNYWSFCLWYVHYEDYVTSENIIYADGSIFTYSMRDASLRPIITLKAGLSIASGQGTESSHYTLSAS